MKAEMVQATEVVFNFDTTGSMRPCIAQVQRQVEDAFTPLFKEIPKLKVGVGANGDYCDRKTSYVTKRLGLTTDLHELTKFVRNVGYTGGGDAAECYELVLHEALEYDWSMNANKVLVLIGDDVPHPVTDAQNTNRLDWRVQARKLHDAGVVVYPVQCLSKAYATPFYRELATMTGGYHLELDQFSEIVDLLRAICYKQVGNDQLQRYEETVARAGRMNRTLDRAFGTLAGRKKSTRYAGTVAPKFTPVPPGRFQILQVDDSQDIQSFVESNDLMFQKGRGFYEFMKTETIQENKEVVLRDKSTGDMFTGDAARQLIGLPTGVRGKLKPVHLDAYDVFVQSTSYNRKLISGTRFLYEVDLKR